MAGNSPIHAAISARRGGPACTSGEGEGGYDFSSTVTLTAPTSTEFTQCCLSFAHEGMAWRLPLEAAVPFRDMSTTVINPFCRASETPTPPTPAIFYCRFASCKAEGCCHCCTGYTWEYGTSSLQGPGQEGLIHPQRRLQIRGQGRVQEECRWRGSHPITLVTTAFGAMILAYDPSRDVWRVTPLLSLHPTRLGQISPVLVRIHCSWPIRNRVEEYRHERRRAALVLL